MAKIEWDFSARAVWNSIKYLISVGYKASFLYLAYVFVYSTIGFYQFAIEATMAFYKIFSKLLAA